MCNFYGKAKIFSRNQIGCS